MSENNVQKLKDMYAAFLRGDINTILANVTEDVTWGTPTVAQEIPWYSIRSGVAGVGDFFATLNREVEFTNFSPSLFAASGDDVIVSVDIGYKLKKNGKAASVASMHRFNLRDGKVTSFRAFEDTAGIREAWRD